MMSSDDSGEKYSDSYKSGFAGGHKSGWVAGYNDGCDDANMNKLPDVIFDEFLSE